MENIPFLIASRRNTQRRDGASWLAKLEAETGLPSGEIQLVPAAESIPRERNRNDLVRQQLVSGEVVRESCPLSDAARGWDMALSACGPGLVVCDMLNHPDYMFRIAASCLIGKLPLLLTFDGDTVGVTSEDLLNGFIVDMYSEDDSWFYEKDMWGAWKQSRPS